MTSRSRQTEYIVFIGRSEYEGETAWSRLTTVTARSAAAAIRMAIDGTDTDGRPLVAIPTRSWRPMLAKTVEQTILEEIQ